MMALEEEESLLSIHNISYMASNITSIFNLSLDSNDLHIFYRYEKNLRINPPKLYYLILAYVCLILIGSIGNMLLVAAVVRKPQMRTIRNVFVINLAVSDLLLCLITMPLTLMEIVTVYWPLGNNPVGCKITGMLQGTSIFVSSLTITAIAVDRHRVIIHPTKRALPMFGAIMSLLIIWIISILVALPSFIWRKIETHQLVFPKTKSISFCFEEWPSPRGRFIYSTIVMILQYFIPIFTMSFAYCTICLRVQRRMKYKKAKQKEGENSNGVFSSLKQQFRMSNTTKLLLSITLIYCFSWFPLNTFNVFVDLKNPFGDDAELMLFIYALCHMAGMSSACSNPLLYGWLNGNFRKEFYEMFDNICPFIHCFKHTPESEREDTEKRSSRLSHFNGEKLNLKLIKKRNSEIKNRLSVADTKHVIDKIEESQEPDSLIDEKRPGGSSVEDERTDPDADAETNSINKSAKRTIAVKLMENPILIEENQNSHFLIDKKKLGEGSEEGVDGMVFSDVATNSIKKPINRSAKTKLSVNPSSTTASTITIIIPTPSSKTTMAATTIV